MGKKGIGRKNEVGTEERLAGWSKLEGKETESRTDERRCGYKESIKS
jgi:hypothetical protein